MTTTTHPISDADQATMIQTRAFLQSVPGIPMTPDARPAYDAMISQTPLAAGVHCEPGSVGGVSGWWCRIEGAPADAVVLYVHGGGYVLGSAEAYRNAASQFAVRAGADAFVIDYALAPEHPFPAAIDHAVAAYDGLVAQGFTRIAIVGDSAGGGLSLALLAAVEAGAVKPSAVAVVSPWADLTLSGESYVSRAAVDPLLDRTKLQDSATLYLAGGDPADPKASPLLGQVSRDTPVLIHVGDDEVLLDDAVRYAELVNSSGGSAQLHIWEGMLHVFTASLESLDAARLATGHIGEFLKTNLQGGGAQ